MMKTAKQRKAELVLVCQWDFYKNVLYSSMHQDTEKVRFKMWFGELNNFTQNVCGMIL